MLKSSIARFDLTSLGRSNRSRSWNQRRIERLLHQVDAATWAVHSILANGVYSTADRWPARSLLRGHQQAFWAKTRFSIWESSPTAIGTTNCDIEPVQTNTTTRCPFGSIRSSQLQHHSSSYTTDISCGRRFQDWLTSSTAHFSSCTSNFCHSKLFTNQHPPKSVEPHQNFWVSYSFDILTRTVF